ncbi:unnamed protein product, partial [Symbiodinium microadriaticum]
RNETPNETYVMLLEKAYAKLHGCYESLLHGLMEKCLADLTCAAHVQVLRKELVSPDGERDQEQSYRCFMWLHLLSTEVYNAVWEKLDQAMEEKRLVACRRLAADPFSDKNSDRLGIKLGDLTIMRMTVTLLLNYRINVKTNGRFTGRWSYGHPVWAEYPEIGRDLAGRTEELKVASPFYKPEAPAAISAKNSTTNEITDPFGDVELSEDDDSDEEEDNNAIDKILKQKNKVQQPGVEGLYWMQIEDFVGLFNRVYIIEDLMWQGDMITRRFLSKWVPGDFIAGSGGPPVDTSAPPPEPEADMLDTESKDGSEIEGKVAGGEDEDEEDEDEESDIDEPINPFTDNPMYPFVVSEPTQISIALFQLDRRWSVSRLGDDPSNVTTNDFASRNGRIEACMDYDRAIGFAVLKLSGLKLRVTTFTMERIVANSEFIQFSNVCSKVIQLPPGRYVIVPFTDIPVDNKVIDYCLAVSSKEGAIDFEINDILKERPMDDMPSDDEDDADAVEKRRLQGEGFGQCPLLLMNDKWEWEEEIEESGSIAVYEQVNDLAFLLRSMRKDVRQLQKEKLRNITRKESATVSSHHLGPKASF